MNRSDKKNPQHACRPAGAPRRPDRAYGGASAWPSRECGMGYRVHSQTGWAKLKTLAEGAKLASQVLWNR